MILPINNSINYLETETAFEVLERAEEISKSGSPVINLGIGQPDFKTPENIVEAGIKALRDGHHGYTPPNGLLALREAISFDLKLRYDIETDPSNIMVMPGGKPTIFFTVMMFGGPGTEIIYPNPGFPIYQSMIKYMGSKPVPIPIPESDDFSLDVDQILSKINGQTRLIILNSPANPTGAITPKIEIDKLVEEILKYPNLFVLSDEIYSELIYNEQKHCSLLQYEEIKNRVIVLDGFSKTYAMTGWRLGYSIWPANLIPHIIRLCTNSHSCANSVAQYAGLEALSGPKDTIKKMRKVFNSRRKLLWSKLNCLEGFKCVEPLGAFYAFPNIKKTGLSSLEAQNLFLTKARVATIAGSSFGSAGEGYLRISYANSVENILDAIDRIRACL